MRTLNEESIESFIRENKDKFNVYRPPDGHLENFLLKLNYRIRHLISIVPYLIRVAVATILIFVTSIIIWNNYIRRDRQLVSLKDKVSLVINSLGNR
jgi:hypothetical protein